MKPEDTEKNLNLVKDKFEKLEKEFQTIKDNYVGSGVPGMPFEYFRNICKFVKSNDMLVDQWGEIIKELCEKAGLDKFDIDADEINWLGCMDEFRNDVFVWKINVIIMKIQDISEKIMAYNYLKICDALAELLRDSEDFRKKWNQFFTIVKLSADEKQIKEMGG